MLKRCLMAVILLVGGILFITSPVYTARAEGYDSTSDVCRYNPNADICKKTTVSEPKELIKRVINTIMFILGLIVVVMVIYGGGKYVMSAGDANKVASAKNTILYAIVGLIVAIAAFAIVRFVVDNIFK